MAAAAPHRFGVYLGILQFCFALSWTVYVIYLPQLAAQAGIDRKWVPWILVLDQLVFAVCDWAAGTMSDRVAKVVGRLGRLVAMVTAGSALAFVLLPVVAPDGAPWLFLVLIVVWAATSSALRAPPLVLLGRHTPRQEHPWLAGLMLFGLGVAGAVSPYLAVALRDADPLLPFAIASSSLVLVTLGLAWIERRLAPTPPAEAALETDETRPPPLACFLAAVALLGFGFQLHVFLNAAPAFLKFAAPTDLEYLLPVFWVGFGLAVLPAAVLTRRYGAAMVMSLGAMIAAAAAWAVFRADALASLVAAQFASGAAWSCILMSAIAGALALGHTGRQGAVTGAMFSILALMALLRIGIIATGTPAPPAWLPIAVWLVAAGLLLTRRARPI